MHPIAFYIMNSIRTEVSKSVFNNSKIVDVGVHAHIIPVTVIFGLQAAAAHKVQPSV